MAEATVNTSEEAVSERSKSKVNHRGGDWENRTGQDWTFPIPWTSTGKRLREREPFQFPLHDEDDFETNCRNNLMQLLL